MNEKYPHQESTFTGWAFGAASRFFERILPESIKSKINDSVIHPQKKAEVTYDHQAPLSALQRTLNAERELEDAAINEEFKNHPFSP
jgi:hypothetical protein